MALRGPTPDSREFALPLWRSPSDPAREGLRSARNPGLAGDRPGLHRDTRMTGSPLTLASLLQFGAFPIDRYRPRLPVSDSRQDDAGRPLPVLCNTLGLEEPRLVAAGPHSTLWSAQDRLLRRRVALEIALRPGAGRVDREAAQLARLSHPGVPRIHAAGALQSGHAWSMREWIDGRSLEQELSHSAVDGNQLLRRCCRVLASAAAILHHAQGRGQIHGALRAAHVLVPSDPARHAVLIGWGGNQEPLGSSSSGAPLVAALLAILEDTLGAAAARGHGEPLAVGLRQCLAQWRDSDTSADRATLAQLSTALREALRTGGGAGAEGQR